MSKHKIITESDIVIYSINQGLKNILSDYAKEKCLDKKSVRILDWGHGRGRTVYLLRQSGYDAYGIDIDPIPHENGFPFCLKKGYIPQEFWYLVSDNGKTIFPDNYFDIVYSEQVVEHVRDLGSCIAEVSRITKPGGIHYHVFPAKWHFTEQHLFMPMIHWLPKNYLRFLLIHLNVIMRNYPEWPDIPESYSAIDKAKIFYNYSTKKTFYRSVKQLKRLFGINNLSMESCETTYGCKRLTFNRYLTQIITMMLKKI